ncbi:glycosyltransferase [Sphingomonas yabuuchiae]|nr:glycosyltransferase [Sphingomonas yabuuchiae]
MAQSEGGPAERRGQEGSLDYPKHIVIYAPNVGAGGGLVLLRGLLASAWPVSQVTAILDQRGRASLEDRDQSIEVHWAEPSLRGRWRMEKLLRDLTRSGCTVLCFHNLPPVLASPAQLFCYIQNAYVIDLIATNRLPWRLRVRIMLEKLIARRFRHRIDRYMVQTRTMADAVRGWYGPGAPPVDILPFVGSNMPSSVRVDPPAVEAVKSRMRPDASWDFIYVSDGSFHKNHRCLFSAWNMLADRGLYPSLAVTLHPDRDVALCGYLAELVAKGLRITDLGQISHGQVLAAYGRSSAMIFPSTMESFGLPLIEAQAADLPILAPERDYVRDVCVPVETFDPESARSIMLAVERFMGGANTREPLLSAQAFVMTLCNLAASDKA